MIHPETGHRLVFNGEIYNFQVLRDELTGQGVVFRGHSDTEVLLHGLVKHGPAYIERLEGMYAFALFDPKDNKLLLARDPMGIKPLYMAAVSNAFLFASEVRGIMASGLIERRFDSQAIAGFLAYGSIPEPCTLFECVRMLPAGCWQLIDAAAPLSGPTRAGSEPRRHWRFPAVDAGVNEGDAVSSIRQTLDASVRDHLVSDVPVGVFLSSGLDSTIVAGLAARHTPQLRTFTVGFADQPDLSEAGLAAETAAILGTQHTDIQITVPDAEQTALAWLQSLDQPSVDGLNTYVISQAVRAQGIVVALSGLGGDELFGGYSSFGRVPGMMKMMRTVNWLPTWGRSALSTVATLGRPQAVREKATDMARTDGGLVELFLQCRRTMSNEQLAALGIDADAIGLTPAFIPPESYAALPQTSGDVIAGLSRLESAFYMRNTLLRDSDTNGMAHSLEIRVPMLDRRLLDYVFALRGDVRLPSGKADKHLLRRSFASLLRPALTERRKTGFTLPIGRWIAGPMRELCESGLAHLKSLNLLRPEGVDGVWQSFLQGPDRVRWSRAFALCVLGLHTKRMV